MFNWPFFADTTEVMVPIVVAIVLVVVMFLAFLLLLAKQYKRCPSNQILVVYGKTATRGGGPKIIHGGATFVIPLLQDYAFLSLEPIGLTVSPPAHLLPKQLGFRVAQAYTVAIGTTPELMGNAAVRLLQLSESEVKQQAKNLIVDALTELAEATGDDTNAEDFHAKLETALSVKLKTLGLQLVSFRRE